MPSLIFVEVNVAQGELKICSRCNEVKTAENDFYMCQGKRRSECKACTIKKNVRYQRKVEAWKHRYIDNDEQRVYMLEYYANNKEKFVEYRKRFKEKYPDYYKLYARKKKNQPFCK